MLLAKAVYDCNLLTVCVRVQWVVSWKFIGSFAPHFSNNNFFLIWYLLTRIALGPWPLDRFCLTGYGRGHVCNLGTTLIKYFRKYWNITVLWMQHDDVIKWKLFALLALCEGNPPVTDGFPSRRPAKRSFNIFLSAHKNRLSKQSRRRCFETPSRSWWRHYNDIRTEYVLLITENSFNELYLENLPFFFAICF